jgi:DNA-binding transcriptional regulator YbjK
VPIATRRKPNSDERRRDLCDAAILLLGTNGARAVTHRKVDQEAGVPDGTTSFYFRTRSALFQAVAERVTELDLDDLTAVSQTEVHESPSEPSKLAQIVFGSAEGAGLTRTKARYELALMAVRDAEMTQTLQQSTARFMQLGRDAVRTLQPSDPAPSEELLEHQTIAAMMFINGVMFGIARGDHPIESPEQLDRYLTGVVRGILLPPITPPAHP